MSCNKYTEQTKELINCVFDMTEMFKCIHDYLLMNNEIEKNDKKINCLLNVLAVYGKDAAKKTEMLRLNILNYEDD